MKLVIKKFSATNPDSKENITYFFALCDVDSGKIIEKFFSIEDADKKKSELENMNKESNNIILNK